MLEADGQPIANEYRLDEIAQTLTEQLESPHQLPAIGGRRIPRKLKHFDVPTRIDFQPDPEGRWTVLELAAADRPGLLARISRALVECGVKVQGARIATVSESADDMFYITDMQHRPITAEERQAAIREALEGALKESA